MTGRGRLRKRPLRVTTSYCDQSDGHNNIRQQIISYRTADAWKVTYTKAPLAEPTRPMQQFITATKISVVVTSV